MKDGDMDAYDSTHLENARRAIIEVTEALRSLSGRLDDLQAPRARHGVGREFDAAAAVETARAVRRSSDDLFHNLVAEALDRGIPLRTLDWSDGT